MAKKYQKIGAGLAGILVGACIAMGEYNPEKIEINHDDKKITYQKPHISVLDKKINDSSYNLGFKNYKVMPGDNLTKIYNEIKGSNPSDLEKHLFTYLNNHNNLGKIKPGNEFKVPYFENKIKKY
ncbi:MAG: hypothetical protein ACOC3X_02735 [Nanoarchaeota archaeon]